ncbi:MAG: restriction endonuclease subunit S [Lachnospiraceae bacterium]|nr:restriction endonuclease subunit S [Lachnospiraceae bacterium]
MVDNNMFPIDWEVDILGHRVRIETGSRNTEDKKDNGKYPFFVRSQKAEHIDTYHYDCEAVLTAGDGVGTGKVFHYYIGKFDVHQRVYVLSEFNGIMGRFLYYYFKMNFLREVEKYTAKSSVDSVRRDTIAKMQIPIPSTREQAAIAEVLTSVDNLIISLQKLIDKKKAIKQGAMQELLTGKKRLAEFHEKWEECILGDVCLVLNGDRGANYPTDSEFVKTGIPFINAGHLHNGIVDFSNMNYISDKKYEMIGGAKINKGDILICLRGSLGKYAICNFDGGAPASSLALLRSNEKYLLNRYLFQILGFSSFKKMIIEENNGSSQPNLSAESIKKFTFLRPGIKEQTAITEVLADMDNEIEQLEKKLTKYQQIKQGMMQELLTGHIRLMGMEE